MIDNHPSFPFEGEMERIGMDCMILSIGENVTTYDACHEDV